VVIPVQDHLNSIEECIRSIYRQGRPPEEVLVVDRGSRDNTRDLLRQCFPSVRFLRLGRRATLSQALNAGIRETGSPLLGILFPGVKLEWTYCKILLEALGKPENADIGFASGKIFKMFRGDGVLDSAGLTLGETVEPPVKRGEAERDEGRFDAVERVLGPARGAAVYRRALLEDVAVCGEIFDETLCEVMEDLDLAWRANLHGWKGLYIPEARAVYDVRDDGPGPSFENALNWEYGRRTVVLKNAPTMDLILGLPRILMPRSGDLVKEPASAMPSLFALAKIATHLGSIRVKRQEIQKRAATRVQ
jgi:GT2 family glycosyltransferase